MSQLLAEQQKLQTSGALNHCVYLNCFTTKHTAVMKEAVELLKGEISEGTCLDALNCGKLSRLIRYLRDGNTFVILSASYAGMALC